LSCYFAKTLPLWFNLSFIAPVFSQSAPDKLAGYLNTLAPRIEGKLALETVAVLQKYWRHAGNQDFNLCKKARRLAHGE